jgi:histidinol-phosphatase (PHP family)
MGLPPDTHVHSEWSWDAFAGSMELTCERAVQLGLPSIAFTEHVDHTVWLAPRHVLTELPPNHPMVRFSDTSGRLTPPPFDVTGYMDSLDRCRSKFPDLNVLSGLEVGEPHRHEGAIADILSTATFDRVLGSLHTLAAEDEFLEPAELYDVSQGYDVVRDYLAEIIRLVHDSDAFSILAHVDFPLRYWPATLGRFDPFVVEEEFRGALRATAATERVLEINTVLPLDATIVQWWREAGGRAVTFGSDAHEPSELARNLREAAAMADALGFRMSKDPLAPWTRS